MKKEEIVSKLAEAGVDITLTAAGEMRAETLELILTGVNAKETISTLNEELKVAKDRAKQADGLITDQEDTINTLNETIEELSARKTPVEKQGLVIHKKTGKRYHFPGVKSSYKNKPITADILNDNQALLEELIEIKAIKEEVTDGAK